MGRAAAAGSAACSAERTRLGSELKVRGGLVGLGGVVSSCCRVKQNPGVSGYCCYTRFELETEFCLCVTSESQREGAAVAEKEAGKRISHEFYFSSSSSRLNIYFS